MKINFGLFEAARLGVGQVLNSILADEVLLYTAMRDYRWNVTGPDFLGLRQLFSAQGGQLAEWIDEVAERTCAAGIGARGNWTELTYLARASAAPGSGLPAEHMLSQLIALHENLIEQLGTDIKTCAESLRDPGTADFLTSLMTWHGKAAWMLRAVLETEDSELSQNPHLITQNFRL